MLLAAGCGGGQEPSATRTVAASVFGTGFRFEVPADWKVERSARAASAASGSDLLSVTVFPLSRPYRPELAAEVDKELDRRIAELAGQLRGELGSVGTAVVDGRRARVYELHVGELVQRLLFVFRGRLEFQLLCRYEQDASTQPCDRLAATFRLA